MTPALMVLHRPTEIFSARHAPTWLLLSFASGAVNAMAVLACERYVTHVTGSVTRLGMEMARLNVLEEVVVVLGAFILGAMMSSLLINARVRRGRTPLYWLPLVIVAVAIGGCGIAGHFGLFGRFGGAPDDMRDFVLLAVLSFASGLQNAAVATSTGLLVRTAHLTGPATDLGIHLVELAYTDGEQRRSNLRHALLRAGKIVAFGSGAAAGLVLAYRFGFLAFVVPAAIVAVAVMRSFAPSLVDEAFEMRPSIA